MGLLVRAVEALTRGAVAQKDVHFRRSLASHHAPVEAHLVAGANAYAKGRFVTVDGETAGTDPGFGLASRGKPHLRQNLLQTFGGLFLRRCGFAQGDQGSRPGPLATSSLVCAGAPRRSSSSALSSSRIDTAPAASLST